MASPVLWLESLPRKLNMLPHLRTMEYRRDFQLVDGKCDSLQFCFRLAGNDLQTLQFEVNGKLYEVGFPHLMVKYPGAEVKFLNADTADVFYFSYQPEAAAFFLCSGLTEDFCVAELPLPESLEKVMKLLESSREHLSEPGFADKLDLGCYTLLHEAMLLLAEKALLLSETDKKILNIASYLQTHYAEKCDMDFLAAKHGFSRRNFLRHWANKFHIPPGEYVSRLKMLEARRLLKETSLPLEKISNQLGFCDVGYFCRFFRRHAGMTPRQYQNH